VRRARTRRVRSAETARRARAVERACARCRESGERRALESTARRVAWLSLGARASRSHTISAPFPLSIAPPMSLDPLLSLQSLLYPSHSRGTPKLHSSEHSFGSRAGRVPLVAFSPSQLKCMAQRLGQHRQKDHVGERATSRSVLQSKGCRPPAGGRGESRNESKQ
jgi:hypothetical protein